MEKLDEKVFCSSCGRKTNHNILHRHEVFSNFKKYGAFTSIYAITSCAGCDHVSFANIFFGDYADRKITVYPEEPKVFNFKHPQVWSIVESSVPESIKDLYKQIIYSYNQNHNILCALGLRTLIEAVCNHLNIKKGYKHDQNGTPLTNLGKKESIEGKINGLYEQHYIIWNQTLILQRIREIGNAATHDLSTPNSDELFNAINIVETLIQNVYELKNHSLLKK